VGGGSGSPRLWRSWQRSCPCRAATAPAGGGGTGGQHGGAALALGAVAPAGVCAGDGPRPVVPARGVAAPCPHHAGRGAQPEPPPSATCCRPIPHRACPCSPRNVRLGGLNPRRRAWSHQRRAGSGGVSPTSERCTPVCISSPQHPCWPSPSPILRSISRPHGAARRRAVGRWGCSRRGGAKRPFEFPIRISLCVRELSHRSTWHHLLCNARTTLLLCPT